MTLNCNHSGSFAWKPINMPRISPGVMTHKLNIFSEVKLVKQKKRIFIAENQGFIKVRGR